MLGGWWLLENGEWGNGCQFGLLVFRACRVGWMDGCIGNWFYGKVEDGREKRYAGICGISTEYGVE